MARNRPARDAERKTRILLVDDHPLFREGVTSLIDLQPDMEVCGKAEEMSEALKAILDLVPDLAIVDISLGKGNGISLIKEIRARRVDLPILVLTMHNEPIYAERALRAGATGYVTKREEPPTVLKAIRRLLDGGSYVSEELASAMLCGFVSTGRKRAKSALEVLSDREFEVFHMIAEGLGVSQVAEQMHRSKKTIETHREKIKKKLGLKSATELVRYALHWARGYTDA